MGGYTIVNEYQRVVDISASYIQEAFYFTVHSAHTTLTIF